MAKPVQPSKRFLFRIPLDLWEKIERCAKDKPRMSMNAIICDLVEASADKIEAEKVAK